MSRTMRSSSPAVSSDPLLESYRTDYYHQMAVIDSLVAKARVLLAFLVGVAATGVAVVREIRPPLDLQDRVTVIVLLVAVFPLAVSAAYLWKAFSGRRYHQIPPFQEFHQVTQSDVTRLRWLRQHYRDCADTNRDSNRVRMALTAKGEQWLAVAVVVTLLAVAASQLTMIEELSMQDDPRVETQSSDEDANEPEAQGGEDEEAEESPLQPEEIIRHELPPEA